MLPVKSECALPEKVSFLDHTGRARDFGSMALTGKSGQAGVIIFPPLAGPLQDTVTDWIHPVPQPVVIGLPDPGLNKEVSKSICESLP